MEKYIYELKMKVRDYECDLQGIVNNANYQHYLEHTRHEFLTSEGISFAKLHEEGIDPVVARITMAYKTPLRSGDEFISKLYLKKEGINASDVYVLIEALNRANFIMEKEYENTIKEKLLCLLNKFEIEELENKNMIL
jgi:YbgC/YbaW family acyl-CoA thioester hydrolase